MYTSIHITRKNSPELISSVNELLRSTASALIKSLGGIFFLFIFATVIWPEQIAMNTWIVVPATVILLLIAHWLLPRFYLGAITMLLFSLVSAITLTAYLFQQAEFIFLYALLPLVGVVTLGWRSGVAVQVVILGMLYWANNGLLVVPVSTSLNLVVAFGGVIAGLLGWTSMQAVLTVTEWSLYSFKQAQNNLEDARDHRGQLAHVVKELDSANIRLERLNRMLVLARAEAEDAKEARNRFALAISHELRTPLNFIISFSEIMVKTPATYATLTRWPAGLYEDIQEIYRSSQHLMRLVNDVLDLGQIENLRMNLIKEWISLSHIVGEAGSMVKRAFDLKNLELRMEIEPDLPLVFVDRTRIRQVLLNLINNSLRFTDQGSVTLRLSHSETNTLLICVEDTGTGIAAEDIPRIFEDFHQVSKDSWRRREGTGLGIPISKKFIELHGGQMWVESEVGVGTRFYFTIPLTSGNGAVVLMDKERDDQYWNAMKTRAEKGKNILTVSRDPAAGEIIAPYVEGFSLITVPPDSDFVQQVNAMLPHALFLDQNIAEEPRVQEKIRRLPYDLPVICFSFPGNPVHPTDLPDCVHYYLVKPFTNQTLVDSILSLGPDTHYLLVVDDDQAMLNLVIRALRSRLKGKMNKQYQLVPARTGQEALESISRTTPDAILLDVNLPDISGLEILKIAQEKDIPVIFITAHEWPQVFPESEQDALRVQLRRPLSRNELSQLLKNLLEVIKPKYPADLSEIIRPADQSD
jgi:signal transduction histidine kinase/CheY-like chemotaxis protein